MIPKNLRSLQGLLSFADQLLDPNCTLRNLLSENEESWDLKLDTSDESLNRMLYGARKRRTYHFLQLTLNELLQNDRMHGVMGKGERVKPVVRATRSSTGEVALSFEFHYPAGDLERVRDLVKRRLQTMMPPREEPLLPSHGTGLYLANFAAGAVGWKLEPEDAAPGILRFTLVCKEEEQ